MKKYLLVFLVIGVLFAACGNKQNESSFKKSYEFSQKALDHATSAQILTQWLANDSTIGKWAYDSLALYHYFYAVNPSAVRNPYTAMFFVDKGLSLNNNNEYLKEIKGKLLLEQGKEHCRTTCFLIFGKTHRTILTTGIWRLLKQRGEKLLWLIQ